MRPSLLALSCLLGWECLLGCEREREAPVAHRSEQLPEGVIARVGSTELRAERVLAIAEAMQVDARVARDRAIFDCLAEAETRRAGSPFTVRASERAASARALLELLRREAHDRGPPSDSELDELVKERWLELDRPASVRAVHAVALTPKDGSPADARRVAAELERAVAGITDAAEFLTKAKTVTDEKVEVRAEPLPAITIDGRGFRTTRVGNEPAGRFDAVFTAAAHAIPEPGKQSGLVETKFGFHVILLVERLPEQRIGREEARRVLADDVFARRAGAARKALLERLEAGSPIAVSRNFEALTAELHLAP